MNYTKNLVEMFEKIKVEKLNENGFEVGDTKDFLDLTDEEVERIDNERKKDR